MEREVECRRRCNQALFCFVGKFVSKSVEIPIARERVCGTLTSQ